MADSKKIQVLFYKKQSYLLHVYDDYDLHEEMIL